jgi:hypothetical protein
MAVMSSSAGVLIDRDVSPFGLAAVTGAVMLIPAVAWLWALRLWRVQAGGVSYTGADHE